MASEEAGRFVGEFNARSRLRKLGYNFDANKLDARKGLIFCIISEEIDRCNDREMSRNGRK